MSEYFFGAGKGQLTDAAEAKIDKIASKHGNMAKAVWYDLEDAGLVDEEGLVASCFVREDDDEDHE